MRRSTRIAAALAVLLPAVAAAPAQTAGAAAAVVETIALDMSGPRPVALLTVGDREAVPVIFDTGASGNVMDLDYARSVGLPDDGPAAVHTPTGAPMQGFRTRIAQGRLGNAVLNDVGAVALPMPATRALAVQGVFGPSTFSGRLVHLDLARGEIRVTPRTPELIPSGPASPYTGGDERRPGLPGIIVEIAGLRFDAHLDTGQPGVLMMPLAMAQQVPLDGELRQAARPARFADGVPRPLFEGRIRGSVRIGPLTLENPEVRFMDGIRQVNVGVQALRGLILVIDPAERRSWLVRPASSPGST